MNTRGNALFLILIAVALFAALSYALTTSGRGSGSIDRETTQIASAQILQSAHSAHTIAQKYILLGIAPRVANNLVDVACAANHAGETCIFLSTNDYWTPGTFKAGNTEYTWGALEDNQNRGIIGLGENNLGDQVIFLENLPEALCDALNKGLNVTRPVLASTYPGGAPLPANSPLQACAENSDGTFVFYMIVTIV